MSRSRLTGSFGSSLGAYSSQAKTRLKLGSRRLVNRIVMPYVDQTVERLTPSHETSPSPEALPPPFVEFHATLHEARTFALADMPAGCQTILSVGANGEWYFDWLEQAYGRVPRHIGVEAYMPKPLVLPTNVEWVEADLAAPDGVAALTSGSVDLVFSGQNVEHLWPDQVKAMLVESNRVLREGGWLVIDSPNRELTAAYQWSMGEHTVELNPDEAINLLTLSGFQVEVMKGVWLCRQHGELLPLEPKWGAEGAKEVLDRMMLAAARPTDSFIWWAEARKVGRPEPAALDTAIHKIFADNWEERVSRLRVVDGVPITLADGRRGVTLDKGQQGYALNGSGHGLGQGGI